MSKHSSGTWRACKHGDYGDYDGECRVIVADDLRIVVVLGYDNEETDANTNLIAAAPDLLEALEAILGKMYKQNWNDGYPELCDQAEAAIDKARGK